MHDICFDLQREDWTLYVITERRGFFREFSTTYRGFWSCLMLPFRIYLPAGIPPVASKAYWINPILAKQVDSIMDGSLAARLIEYLTSRFASPSVVGPKKVGGYTDCRQLREAEQALSVGAVTGS